ncbi:hypothetical protein [Methylobacterium nigriterrae]|uniref:hypothetical protein n=1 Tax=Methylobacterium nigriterrae TaxID=3127512 RepID=UPI0030140418
MAEASATIGDLVKAKAVTAGQVEAAVDAYMADPTTTLFQFADECVLDLAAAVKADRHASAVLRDKTVFKGAKRAAVRTAILLARPEKR